MAAQPSREKIIDQSQVTPPPGSVSTTTVPLTFFDIAWIFCCPLQRIFLYEFPCSTLHFTQTILPHLKQSLSLTLRHFYPFAANLISPPPPDEPYILYKEGDSIQLLVVESDDDFNHLSVNHELDIKALQSLVPERSPAPLSPNTTHVVPTMAIQFTVFPNSGISFGLTFNHAAADGRSFNHFVKFWASIHRSKSEDLTSLPLPYHNKGIIKDPNGLSSIYLNEYRRFWKNIPAINSSSNNLLVTILIKRDKIQQLKDRLATQSKHDNDPEHNRPFTTFVVVCAFMWVNITKLQEKFSSLVDDDDDDICYFLSIADCRERFELSIPGTYFGNCLMYFRASARRRELLGESGMGVAARAFARKIGDLGRGVMGGADRWVLDTVEAVKSGRVVTIAGSPKFRVYETDFGWEDPEGVRWFTLALLELSLFRNIEMMKVEFSLVW